jgi:hypothetical protein
MILKNYSKPEDTRNFDISIEYDCKIQKRVQQLWGQTALFRYCGVKWAQYHRKSALLKK